MAFYCSCLRHLDLGTVLGLPSGLQEMFVTGNLFPTLDSVDLPLSLASFHVVQALVTEGPGLKGCVGSESPS